jgi:CRISPR/Cas system CMR-associated protein Cmr5 small subunit
LDLYVTPIQTSVARIPSIIVENGIGQPTIQVVTSNLEHLANVETLLSFFLHCASFK